MSFNPEERIQALYDDFQALVVFATDAQARTAKDVEAHLFSNLLKLGAHLLKLYFEGQAAQQSKDPLPQTDAPPLRYHRRRRRSYFSVFGKIHFTRAYFWAAGQGGATPLDDQLDLPEDCYSALLCDWACFAVTEQSYGASGALLEHILGVRLPKLSLEQIAARQAASVTTFYEHKPPPKPEEEGSILVVQADGKGVPMLAPALEQVRRSKGDKRTKKKEAVVTTLYSVDRYRRTPQQVAKEVLLEAMRNTPHVLHDPGPFTEVSDLEESGVQLRVFLWCKPEDYFRVKEPCIENIKYAFDEHGIEIPFPQRVIHFIKQPPPEVVDFSPARR